MTIYYSKNEKGEISAKTESQSVAIALGFDNETEEEIVRGYDGKLYFKGKEPKYEPSYKEKRAAEYPAVEDQLDMIYWDKVNNTNKWVETIGAIKAKYPKA